MSVKIHLHYAGKTVSYHNTIYQGVKNFTWWLVHLVCTLRGHSHLMWQFSPHVAILTLCPPRVGILTSHPPCMVIFTLHGHFHLTSTSHGHEVTLGMCMLSYPLHHTKSPCANSHHASTLHGHSHLVWPFSPHVYHM